MMNFSLIVPTLGRTIELNTLLISLTDQIFKNFEVIIVDQNEDNLIEDTLSKFNQILNLRHLKITVKGASRARNVGIELAKGEIITFPDDDCEYPDSILEKVFSIFNLQSELDGITVRSIDKEGFGKIARLSNKSGIVNRYNVLTRSVEFGIFLKSSQLKGFQFNEELGVGTNTPWWSDEGPDLLLRMIEKGSKIMYFSDLVIFHPNPIRIYDMKAYRRSYRYGCGRGRFLKIHNYPIWYVLFVFGKYIFGCIAAVLHINLPKANFYFWGLRGRIKGYLSYMR